MSLWRYAILECGDAIKRPGEAWAVIGLFALATTAFPLALPAGDGLTPEVACAALWTALLFASCLSVRGIFDDDMRSGRAEQYLMIISPGWGICAVKALAHWLRHFALAAPAAALLSLIVGAGAPPLYLCGAVLTGGAACSLLCTATAALLPPDKGAAAAVILLPLYVPIIAFGAQAAAGDARALAALAGVALLLLPCAVAIGYAALKARIGE